MKTILVPVKNSFFIRNFLRTDALRLLEDANVRLVLMVPADKLSYYEQEFREPFLKFEVLPSFTHPALESLFQFFEMSSIHSRTVFMQHNWQLRRSQSGIKQIVRLPIFILRLFLWNIGRLRLWRKAVRKVYNALRDSTFDKVFERYRPDLVFCPSLVYPEDHVLARAARKHGVKLVGMILSWDNFYSKTFLRAPPDRLIVHTKMIAEQAERYADYPRERITITGIPQYDGHFRASGVLPRDQFFSSIGADPKSKLILYALSGKPALNIEFEILKVLSKLSRGGFLCEKANVLVRPYPRYDFSALKLRRIKEDLGFLACHSVSHVGSGRTSWEFDEASLSLLRNSLAHADIVITMYSTFFIEAAIFNKPLIGIAFDGELKLNYWNSARRFFDWDHLADIKHLGGVWLVRNEDELREAINTYLVEPRCLERGRKEIVTQQCEFTDGMAAQRVSRILIDEL